MTNGFAKKNESSPPTKVEPSRMLDELVRKTLLETPEFYGVVGVQITIRRGRIAFVRSTSEQTIEIETKAAH